jgi:hypothetical protein
VPRRKGFAYQPALEGVHWSPAAARDLADAFLTPLLIDVATT